MAVGERPYHPTADLENRERSWKWQHTTVIPTLGRLRQKNHHEFYATMG